MNARLYDPVIGRFFSPDPIIQDYEATQGYNRYSYCRNNPVNRVDLNGAWDTDLLNEKTGEHVNINDGINQVIQVSDADYKTLQKENFDPNTENYKNILNNGILRTDLFYTVENVLKGKGFISYGSTATATSDGNCKIAAVRQNTITPLGRAYAIDVLIGNFTNMKSSGNLNLGVDYIKTQLESGNSIEVGLYTGHNEDNTNILTGHFVNIAGMGFDEKGNYFSYYDNARSISSIGADLIENRFYFGKYGGSKIPVLYDKTKLGEFGIPLYLVTEIRKNAIR